MESITPKAGRSGIGEAKFHGVVNLSGVSWVNNVVAAIAGRVHGVDNVGARERLEVLVAEIDFPPLDLLEQPGGDDVLVVAGRPVIAVDAVPIKTKPWPAHMLAYE